MTAQTPGEVQICNHGVGICPISTLASAILCSMYLLSSGEIRG